MAAGGPRDALLAQIRALSIEDRDFIEAVLMRDAHEQGRREDSIDALTEIEQRAADALSSRNPSYSREESVARALATVEAVRSRTMRVVRSAADRDAQIAAAARRAPRG